MTNDLSRRSFLQLATATAASAAFLSSQTAYAAAAGSPVIFWATDGVQPNDLVMATGGALGGVTDVLAWRLPDDPSDFPDAGLPEPTSSAATLKTQQPNEGSLKFHLPSDWKQGVYGFKSRGGQTILLNRPLLWFIQPTTLLPGLADNEVPVGVEAQIVGKDMLLPDGSGSAVSAIRPSGGAWRHIAPTSSDRYSLIATLPADLTTGAYELAVHNGSGGPAAWSEPLAFQVRAPEVWPQKQWNVREHGALGDGITDDSAAIRDILASAEKMVGVSSIFRGAPTGSAATLSSPHELCSKASSAMRPFSSGPSRWLLT